MHADVLDEAGHAFVCVAAVAALVFAVTGPLQALHVNVRALAQRQAHLHRWSLHPVLLYVLGRWRGIKRGGLQSTFVKHNIDFQSLVSSHSFFYLYVLGCVL